MTFLYKKHLFSIINNFFNKNKHQNNVFYLFYNKI